MFSYSLVRLKLYNDFLIIFNLYEIREHTSFFVVVAFKVFHEHYNFIFNQLHAETADH